VKQASSYIEIKKLVGSVSYQTPTGIFGGGGANPAKWKSTKEKLDPSA